MTHQESYHLEYIDPPSSVHLADDQCECVYAAVTQTCNAPQCGRSRLKYGNWPSAPSWGPEAKFFYDSLCINVRDACRNGRLLKETRRLGRPRPKDERHSSRLCMSASHTRRCRSCCGLYLSTLSFALTVGGTCPRCSFQLPVPRLSSVTSIRQLRQVIRSPRATVQIGDWSLFTHT